MVRDYKNVHVDVNALEKVDLIQRTEKGLLVVPWNVIDANVIDAHVRLVAYYNVLRSITRDAGSLEV